MFRGFFPRIAQFDVFGTVFRSGVCSLFKQTNGYLKQKAKVELETKKQEGIKVRKFQALFTYKEQTQ